MPSADAAATSMAAAASSALLRVAAAAADGLIDAATLQQLEDGLGDRVEACNTLAMTAKQLSIQFHTQHVERQGVLEREQERDRAEMEAELASKRAARVDEITKFELEFAAESNTIMAEQEASLGDVHRLSTSVADDGMFARQLLRRLQHQHQRQPAPTPASAPAYSSRVVDKGRRSRACILM